MSEEDTKVADIFDKDIENFGKDLDKMIEHLNIVIATHNKQVEEIERLKNITKEAIEYIKKHGDYNIKWGGCTEELDLYKINELLEILDKKEV